LKNHLFLAFALIILLFFSCASFKKTELPTDYQINTVTGNYWIAAFSKISGLNYIITFPKDYETDTKEKYPLIIFLHSTAEIGDDINLVMQNPAGEGNGLAPYALKKDNFRYITISPLCPSKAYWPLLNNRLNLLIKDITQKYYIDNKRIYLTGVSMGGMGVWSLAMSFPKWFAAIAPISGGIYFPPMIENTKAIKNIPTWAFHDLNDPDIPISKEQGTIFRLQKKNKSVRYTISNNGLHYIHEKIYDSDELFDWFLSVNK